MSNLTAAEIRFNFMHAELTADQIDTYWTTAPTAFAPSKGMTELESFQASVWTSAILKDWDR
ncbi:MAG: hypothetical protein ACREBW_03180 [Candidatus Micrarchaeaceae archaeon]